MVDPVIDISHHNGLNLDFGAAAASGVLGVIQKATQGTGYADPTWAANRAAIRVAGLLFGSFHFGDGSDGAGQAQHFLTTVGPNAGELLALDLETNNAGSSMTLEEGRAFVATVQGSINKWPVLYGGHGLKGLLNGTSDPVLSNCPLWLAQYGPTAVLPPGWGAWTLWQYTDGAYGSPAPIDGVGQCDLDQFNGANNALAAFWASVSA